VAKQDLHPHLTDLEKADLFEEGLTFFNAGRFFEAHEPWEEIWRSTNPEPRNLYQGLVQVAAGLHIWLARDKPAPAARVLGRGLKRLRPFQPAAVGIDIAALVAALEPWQRWLEERTGPAPTQLPTIRRR
jgi:predicted metal-dependent hydrolase